MNTKFNKTAAILQGIMAVTALIMLLSLLVEIIEMYPLFGIVGISLALFILLTQKKSTI